MQLAANKQFEGFAPVHDVATDLSTVLNLIFLAIQSLSPYKDPVTGTVIPFGRSLFWVWLTLVQVVFW
jgi:hypothetical protein